ncbi:MAG TPA: sigma-70 family RNA polymerase sigma factor [Flavisolibacter sp.]|nr:sigma-70 family RNA polymerase sigma factor [Flavisolibacter sp.]
MHTILEGCVRNEPKYQKVLYERYYAYAFKIVFRYIYRYEKVPDIVNDGFVKLFKGLNTFNKWESTNLEASFLSWLKRIVINAAIDELRRNNLMPEIGNMDESVWEHIPDNASADHLLRYKELIAVVKKLPPAYRTVFNMYVIDGFDHQEIAAHLRISVGTSKSNLFKAKAFLQKILTKDMPQQIGTCNF